MTYLREGTPRPCYIWLRAVSATIEEPLYIGKQFDSEYIGRRYTYQ